MRHPARPGAARLADGSQPVVVAGGGIAGIAAAVGLAERGVPVIMIEPHDQLGGRVRAWPVVHGADQVTMSRGFHAFFRQYYNLRALLRRADPALRSLVPVADYPLVSAGGHTDSFARIPRTPPLNLAAFVAQSPSFQLRDLAAVDVAAALELLDVEFPATFSATTARVRQLSSTGCASRTGARHLALEVFARSFFAHPDEFSAGELVAMFHSYFLGSAEGLLFDVPRDDYDTACGPRCGAIWTILGSRFEPARPLLGSMRVGTCRGSGWRPGREIDAVRWCWRPILRRRAGWLWTVRMADAAVAGASRGSCASAAVRGLAAVAGPLVAPTGRRSSAPAASARWTTSRCWSASRRARGVVG